MAQRTVLVIDDDIDLVEIIRLTLQNEGLAVIDAQSGADGLALARQQHPDVILLDVMMSRVDEGFEVAHRLRADARTRDIPILMLTAVADQTGFEFDPHRETESLPVNEYLEKPVSPQRLVELIRRHLPEGR